MSTLKDDIINIGMHDATIAAYLALWNQSDIPYKKMLEMLVLNLQSEKDGYFKQVVKLTMERSPKPLLESQLTDTQQLKDAIALLSTVLFWYERGQMGKKQFAIFERRARELGATATI